MAPDFVGIDISKKRLDVHLLSSGEHRAFANDETGREALVALLASQVLQLVVMEATGGYERGVAAALAAQKLPFAIVNPRQVRDFAKATGRLAKTDRLDAKVLAEFGRAIEPRQVVWREEQFEEGRELHCRRRQLIVLRTGEKNRLQQASSSKVKLSIKQLIEHIDEQLGDLDKDLDEWLKTTPGHEEQLKLQELLLTAPGVGPTVSRTLILELPELGKVTSREIAALVGLAPLASDSGQRKGRRRVWGGRAEVRAMLYMAVRGARRARAANPIKTMYERLRAAGKPPKLAMIAAARRLLVILNAMAKAGTEFA